MIGMFIREVESELIVEDFDEFLSPANQQRGDGPLASFSANDISKLFERQISATCSSHRRSSIRDSLSEGNLEPFKVNNRVSSRRSRGRYRSVSEVEAKARKEEEEKKKKEGLST